MTSVEASTAISSISLDCRETLSLDNGDAIYDLQGREIELLQAKKGLYIIKKGNTTKKIIIK